MEWTPHWSPRASSDTVSCTFFYRTWQVIIFIIFTIFTITACVFSYSLSISFWTQDLALQQILSSIDLFFPTGLITRTLGPCNDLTLLNGCTGKCVRLSRLLVGFRMHFKSLHFHSFHSFHSFSQFQSSAFVENYTVFQKSDAKIQITITTAYLTRIKYPLSRFNYHLSGVNVANFNKIHRTVSEQQLF